jgi:membrane-associated protein
LPIVTTSTMAILPSWLDPSHFLQHAGGWATVVIMLILFAECGLLIGFFLPGDTMLFIAGLYLANGTLHVIAEPADPAKLSGPVIGNLLIYLLLLWLAAFIGNMVGYWIGRKVGPAVFNRPDAKFLKAEYIQRSEHFFQRSGKIPIVLARFVPIVRTVATVMAGASRMNAKIYTLYSALGGLLWVALVTLAGFFLGQIPFVADHVDMIFVAAVVIVVLFTAVPAVLHLVQRRRSPGA